MGSETGPNPNLQQERVGHDVGSVSFSSLQS